jgi:hypothetical protein
MPYLEYLFCEKCGNYARLDIDPGETISAYRKEGRESTSIHQQTMIWDYMIYSCDRCSSHFRYTYKDVERRVREYFFSLSQEFREYFDKVIEQHEYREQHGGQSPTLDALRDKKSKAEDRIKDLYTKR